MGKEFLSTRSRLFGSSSNELEGFMSTALRDLLAESPFDGQRQAAADLAYSEIRAMRLSRQESVGK